MADLDLREFTSEDITNRLRLEEILRSCGAERDWLEYKDTINRGKVRSLVGEARAAGITVRDISRMTGLSTQTLHTWLRGHMRPVPFAHYGLKGPQAASLEEAALRVIAEKPGEDWAPEEVRAAIPPDWPRGSVEEVADAMEVLARTHQIWDGDTGYRLAPPAEIGSM